MRKRFYSLVLIAAGLLIGTNVWAQTYTCKIGTQGYPSVAAAIAAVPANGVPTTVQMIADETIENLQQQEYATIAKMQNVVLDLNGYILSVTSDGTWDKHLYVFNVKGTMTIEDTQAPENPKDGRGKIYFNPLRQWTGYRNASQSTILVCGTLIVKSGIVWNTGVSSAPNGDNIEGWVFDTSAGNNDVVITIEGGYIYSGNEVVRTLAQSTYKTTLNIIGGEIYGMYGIVFAHDPSNKSGIQTINISGGHMDGGVSREGDENGMPLIRLYTVSENNMGGTVINVSGGKAENMDILRIQHTNFSASISLEQLADTLAKKYPQVFNITGGTYKSENYEIKCVETIYDPEKGYIAAPGGEKIVTEHTLPTLIDGALFRDSLHSDLNPDGTITIVPLWAATITPDQDGNFGDIKEPTHKLEVKENVAFTGADDSIYSLVVDGADATVKNGAILNVGPGGVQAINGGRIIVEAGGILKVGEYGFEGADAEALVVYSDTEHSGVVAISPVAYLHNTPALKINLSSSAYEDDADFYWQFFAIPTNGDCHLDWNESKVSSAWMKKYDAKVGDWTFITNPADLNKPFVGYAMTSSAAQGEADFTMEGNLVGRENATLILTSKGDDANWNLFGNSYLAPINVEKMLGDISVSEAKIARYVYIFNEGNWIFNNGAVQHFTHIPPMNAFFMYLTDTDDAAFTINYANTVWGNEVTTPMYAPSRKLANNVMNINVKADNKVDNFYMMASNEDSYNVIKMKNEKLNLFASVDNHDYAMFVNEDLNGVHLSLDACDAVEYTMTFNNADGYILIDHANGAQVAMTDGATYTFVATPNETVENRFEIRKAGGVVTDLAEMKAAHAVKGIYTAAGQYVGKADRWNTLPAGMYIVDGVRMAK